jgi:polar amino acid transport system permease protein
MYLAVTTLMSFGQSLLEDWLKLGNEAGESEVPSFAGYFLGFGLRRGGPVPSPAEPSSTTASAVAAPAPSGEGLSAFLAGIGATGHGPTGDVFVDCRNVCKSYGGREILSGINLKVRRGEVVVLIGPSGSGKSTLLRMINHLESIDGGEVLVGGEHVGYREVDGRLRPVRNLAGARARARIGMVFQHFNLFDHLPVEDNVWIAPIHVYGQSPDDARRTAADLLTDVGLGNHMKHLPHRLSGGQQQRVAIVRALAISPRLMLFDEPTSALDPELVDDVLQLMRRLAEAGMTMIVVTHELRFARAVADRIVFMADGRVVEEGAPEKILTAPREERTRKFLGHLLQHDN